MQRGSSFKKPSNRHSNVARLLADRFGSGGVIDQAPEDARLKERRRRHNIIPQRSTLPLLHFMPGLQVPALRSVAHPEECRT